MSYVHEWCNICITSRFLIYFIFEVLFFYLQYGEIEEMNVCDNLGDHLVGNVYTKFRREEDAEKAVADLNNRWFGGRPVYAELSPVTDFREACCRQYEMGYFFFLVFSVVHLNFFLIFVFLFLFSASVPEVDSATSCT